MSKMSNGNSFDSKDRKAPGGINWIKYYHSDIVALIIMNDDNDNDDDYSFAISTFAIKFKFCLMNKWQPLLMLI